MKTIYLKLAQYRILETDRLYLRPVVLEDAEAMFAYASDEENVRWSFPVNRSIEETRNIISSIY